MAYTINLTNGAIFATIPDGTRDTSSSLVIIGKNYTGYGEFIGENFVHVLENNARNTPPDNPLTGQLWYDTSESKLKVYDSAIFKTLGTTISSLTEPLNKVEGDMWYDTETQQVKVYNEATLSYDIVGPLYSEATGITGPVVSILFDTSNNEHSVTYGYANNKIVSISHSDAPFTINAGAPIAGFTGLINPGIHLASTIVGQVPQFTGTSSNSELLDGIDSAGFLSSINNDVTSGTLGVLNDGGLVIGADSDLQLSIIGSDAYINNSTTDGKLIFQANPQGVSTDVISIISVGADARARVSTPLASTDIANMDYVDTTSLAVNGSNSMSANLNAGTNRITNLADPVNPQDAATLQFVLDQVLGAIYTVGSYFFGPDPSATIPGTWVQLPAGTFLMASATGNGSTGGANTTTLTQTQLPTHNHVFAGNALPAHSHTQDSRTALTSPNTGSSDPTSGSPSGTVGGTTNSVSAGTPTGTIQNRGDGQAFDSRPQYEEVEVWKRTA